MYVCVFTCICVCVCVCVCVSIEQLYIQQDTATCPTRAAVASTVCGRTLHHVQYLRAGHEAAVVSH